MLMRSVPVLTLAGALATYDNLLAQTNDQGGRGNSPADPVLAAFGAAFENGQYKLPPLPYGYDALEPYIDAETMRLHHDKHHQAYVNGLNHALKELGPNSAAESPSPPLLSGLEEDLSFNAGGHLLHTLFWSVMAPKSGGEPQGDLADALTHNFGSVDQFRTRFASVAAGVKGSGWAILAHEPVGDRLMILQLKQHDLQLAPWAAPLLVLDVWEHAYYLKYHNVRGDYVKAWWNVVNWPAVADAMASSRKHAQS